MTRTRHASAAPPTMPWPHRLLVGLVAALLAAGATGMVTRHAYGAGDPSIGHREYTGTPVTDSAVTESGDSAYPGLKVTVSQTKQLTNQAVTVTWTGATPTGLGGSTFQTNFMSIMQCWGDDPTAPADNPQPARETCEYGSFGGATKNQSPPTPNFAVMERTVSRTDQAERTAVGADGQALNYWADTGGLTGSVPFWPAESGWGTPNQDPQAKPVIAPPGSPIDSAGGGIFNATNTNEDHFGVTRADGTGEELFTLDTALEAPWLGCGDPVAQSSAAGKSCWLVLVPQPGSVNQNDDNVRSPLSMSLWQHKIAFRLDFKSVASQCPIGAAERRMIGSELPVDAEVSWQAALCASTNVPYNLTTESEDSARTTITSSLPGSPRMALVSRPLAPDPDHPIAYAPVTLTGFVIGFNIERNMATGVTVPDAEQQLTGSRLAHLNLTPRLVAKLLTESYIDALPPGPQVAYVAHNPVSLFTDPDFAALNPEMKYLVPGDSQTASKLVVELTNSDTAAAVWRWIAADPDARAWLAGTSSGEPAGRPPMTVNPYYSTNPETNPTGIAFDPTGTLNYPKSDPTCSSPTSSDPTLGPTLPECILDYQPYVNDMTVAAQNTRLGNPTKGLWNFNVGSPGWGGSPLQPAGSRMVLCITDTADAARFGLQTASLRNSAGAFVAPDTTGLLAGEQAMTATADPRVISYDPTSAAAKKAKGAYPGTMISYAAVAIKDIDDATDPTARTQYADFVTYATGTGQTPGLDFGDLPPGYAPLPPGLQAEAQIAISEIKTGKLIDFTPGGTSGNPPTGGGTVPGGTTGNGATGPDGGPPAGGAVPAAGVGPAASPPANPVPQALTGRTPGDPSALAIARWVLLVGFLVGVGASLAAPLTRRGFRRLRLPTLPGDNGGPPPPETTTTP